MSFLCVLVHRLFNFLSLMSHFPFGRNRGVSWLFYQGEAIAELLDWGGVLLTSAVAFLLPLYLALRILITTDAEGSIDVYGTPVSRKTQIMLLYVLLFVAATAVALAIVGQIVSDKTITNYLLSKAYLNDTNVTIMSQAHYQNNRAMRGLAELRLVEELGP